MKIETNIVQFPIKQNVGISDLEKLPDSVSNPSFSEYEKIEREAKKLDSVSAYKSSFDYSIYESLMKRYSDKPVRGGVVFRSPLKLVNSHSACQQCLYTLEVDTYGRGCVHDCVYCYAKAELTVHGYWNNPIPLPVDINILRSTFYTVFETNKKSKWRSLLEKRIPLRIGSMSDSFMFMDKKYKVTQELLRLLKFYNYPYIIFTRSDLVAHDDYLKLMDTDLASIQFSISSINDEMNKLIEPGAPSAKRRLISAQTLSKAGFWTTVRINPLFPIYPDGYFSDPNFKWDGEVPKFNYTDFDIVDALKEYNVPSMLVGFARLSSYGLNQIEKATGFNLRPFFDKTRVNKSVRDFHYTDKEITAYYNRFKLKSLENGIDFSTCYIGNGESHFWGHQDMWSNKSDCCNAKNKADCCH